MYDNLFEPITVAGLTIPNRIVRTAHGTFLRFPKPGDTTSPLIKYHEHRARGGVGLSVLEVAPVHLSSMQGTIPLHKDSVIEGYRTLVDAVHPHGMKVFQQLWHGGHAGRNTLGGPPWSASDIPNPVVGVVPVAMTQSMIDEIVGAFAAAARRCRQGGLDGVEVHAAHGYLPAQFFSRATNRRTDSYGGDLVNRVRFCREVLQAIRAEVGPHFPISLRISADDEFDGGLEPVETMEIVRLLEPHFDSLSVSLGSYWSMYKMLAPMDEPTGYELQKAAQLTRVTTKATVVTGRVTSLEQASQIVADGVADMVSMVRALIADPQLVVKSRAGRGGEVRPCIGTNQACPGTAVGHVECVVNPGAGHEDAIPVDEVEPAEVRKRVLIAGGGPAGLEAARMAALRGHEVVLYEMTAQLGGQATIAASAPFRQEMAAIIGYLSDELKRLGVSIKLRTYAEPDVIDRYRPDALVVATGSAPRRDGFQVSRPSYQLPGFDLPHVHTSWDVFGFGGRVTVGNHALVFDDTANYEAISVSEELLHRGAAVTVVSRFDSLGERVIFGAGNYSVTTTPAKERLLAHPGFSFLPSHYLTEITDTDVELAPSLNVAGTRIRKPTDTVVLIGFNETARDLVDYYPDAPFEVHAVGDANGSRTLQAAIAQGAAVGRSL